MKTKILKMKAARSARSVLECGSHLPLCNQTIAASQSARRLAESKTWRSFVALLCFCLLPSAFWASGQSYSIDWSKIAGGGGTSTGATYQVTGTIGQPDASGTTSGGNYTLTGGFWSLIAAVQTVGSPTLAITHVGNSVKVSWPYPSTGWTLQQNPNLKTTSWSTSGGVANDGTNNFITVTSPTGNLFFRLSNP